MAGMPAYGGEPENPSCSVLFLPEAVRANNPGAMLPLFCHCRPATHACCI